MRLAGCLLLASLSIMPAGLFAQTQLDTGLRKSILLDTAVVIDAASYHTTKTVYHVLRSDGETGRTLQSASNLSDFLSRLPGFSQITTGGNISKPVFHGMYGNRLLVLVNGLKYDAQQWQDEHGLGLSQIGIKQVNTFEQAQSAEYGAEAIGGVIVLQDESADSGKRKLDANIRLHSNTYGTLSDIGFSNGLHRIRWNIRGGYENNADYTDGDGTRVLNSRNKGYYLKAGAGFTKGNWRQYNYYNFSYNQFGFIIPDLGTFFTVDDRQSRAMKGPHHNVMLHFLNSQNDFQLRHSTLQVTAGLQSNQRAEDEGGGQISLDMHLLSFIENATWTKELMPKTLKLELRQNLLYQLNTNHGPRILIPDANIFEANASAKLSYDKPGSNFFAEASLGGNDRNIQTFETKYLNAPGKEAQPFHINRMVVNGAFTAGIRDKKQGRYQLYYMLSTGSRSANLAELSSDGLHEGSYQYEIGRSDLAMEQNISDKVGGNMGTDHSKDVFFEVNAAAYYNLFSNYIYLAPTGETRFGYPVYRYRQQNAGIGGIDASYLLRKKFSQGGDVSLQQAYSVVEGILDFGENLPFIPPPRLTTTIQYNFRNGGIDNHDQKIADIFISPQLVYNFAQNKPAPNELPSSDYALVHLSAGATLNPYKKTSYLFSLGIRNLLNKAYADHLSRIRYYGLNNQGLNIVLTLALRTQW